MNQVDGSEQGVSRFAIGTVVKRLQQDFPHISQSSLRFLEREGLLGATRSEGGHRLYSDIDIERIRRIKTLQAGGLSLEEVRQRLVDYDQLPGVEVMADVFLRMAAAGNLESATQMIFAADEAGHSLETIFGEVLRPVLEQVGIRWEQGTVLVSQEKEISESVRDIVADLTVRHTTVPAEAPLFLAGCVEGEQHELGLLMIVGLLKKQGFRVRYLGVDIAPRFLLDAVRLNQPHAVLLSITLELNLFSVRDSMEALRAGLEPKMAPLVIAGGPAIADYDHLVQQWGATAIVSRSVADATRLAGQHLSESVREF